MSAGYSKDLKVYLENSMALQSTNIFTTNHIQIFIQYNVNVFPWMSLQCSGLINF